MGRFKPALCQIFEGGGRVENIERTQLKCWEQEHPVALDLPERGEAYRRTWAAWWREKNKAK
jgi:hypothetical protein